MLSSMHDDAHQLSDAGAAALAAEALRHVGSGQVIGLGTGHAATAFVRALGARVAAGLDVRGVPTSDATAALARSVGIKLLGPDDVDSIDVDVDGADEVDPHGNLIKGYGGALLREKIVALLARRFIVLVGDEKLVPVLGGRGRLPVEVTPFAVGFVRRRLDALGHPGALRLVDGHPFVTDNGNHILDCHVGPIREPAALDTAVTTIPGVLGTGLFVGMRPTALVWDGARCRELRVTSPN
jgi:ribose 5-phosphate isomerase A